MDFLETARSKRPHALRSNLEQEYATNDATTPSFHDESTYQTFDSYQPILAESLKMESSQSESMRRCALGITDFEPFSQSRTRATAPFQSIDFDPVIIRLSPCILEFSPISSSCQPNIGEIDATNWLDASLRKVRLPKQNVSAAYRHNTDFDRQKVNIPSQAACMPQSKETAWTTLILRNLPKTYTRSMLLREIEHQGFLHDINFLHFPIDVRRKHAAGYCFVSLISPEAASRFFCAFHQMLIRGKKNATLCRVLVGHARISEKRSCVAHFGEAYQALVFADGQCCPLDAVLQENCEAGREDTCELIGLDTATTLMLRGIPNKYTKQLLLEDFAARGVLMDIDFFHLPIDLNHKCNIGYCFVNLTSKEGVDRFFDAFEGLSLNKTESRKICSVTVARVQGQMANIDFYRNALVMTMRDEYRPVILKDGEVQPLPPSRRLVEVKECASRRIGLSTRSLE